MNNQHEVIIEASEIHKSFGANKILNGISLKVSKGEVVVLIGASGSGKTTFIRCLNLLETFESGCVRVNGHTLGYVERPDGSLVPTPGVKSPASAVTSAWCSSASICFLT